MLKVLLVLLLVTGSCHAKFAKDHWGGTTEAKNGHKNDARSRPNNLWPDEAQCNDHYVTKRKYHGDASIQVIVRTRKPLAIEAREL